MVEAPAELDEQNKRDYRFNMVACIIDDGGYAGGISLLSMTTILPLFVRQLTDSAFLVGLIPAIYWAGIFLPQLFVARLVSHFPRLRPWVMSIAFFERIFLVLLAPLTLWLWQKPGALLVAFFLMWTGYALSTGLNFATYLGLVAKIIPANRRGLLYGLSGALGGVLGVAGAKLAEYLLQDGGMPYGFAWCFGIGSAVLAVTVVPLGFVREPVGKPPEERPHAGPRQIVRLLRGDPAFARFVWGCIAYAFAGAAPAFYTVHAIDHLGATAADVARFTAVLTATTVVTAPAWGWLADRTGNRRVVLGSAILAGMGLLVALLAPSLGWFYLVFALNAAASPGMGFAVANIILEYGPGAKAPAYVAVHSSCTMPASALAPLLAGGLAQTAGYHAVFVAGAILAGLAILGYWRAPEPRERALG